jgi:hypothetical protein
MTIETNGEELEPVPTPDRRTGPIARFDHDHNVLWIGGTPLPFRPGTDRNGELIEVVGTIIRSLRGLRENEPCRLRRSELHVLAGLLDLDDPELRRQMRRHLGLSRREAGDTVNQLRRALVEQAVAAE